MKNIRINTGFTIFLLFFGISLLEAYRTRNWVAVSYWVLIAALFLLLGRGNKPANHSNES